MQRTQDGRTNPQRKEKRRKMEEKKLKTSEAQRRAVEAYRARKGNNYATVSVTLPREEAAECRKILARYKRKPVDVWREAIERLKAEPIPTEESTPTQTDGESIATAAPCE